ncbi:hypothetical protein GCM10022222_32350 [Amycolatopsis ultiminotia]|uniref:Uncharacterized protein n=1 Tax=Amycolatopsis ultiminotia TaxID=543629 RepID=A0ABP6W7C0_9PSEU
MTAEPRRATPRTCPTATLRNPTKGSNHDRPHDAPPVGTSDTGFPGQAAHSTRRECPSTAQRGNRQTAPVRRSRHSTRHAVPGPPTPEQWAQQQLVNAPERSRQWAKEVAGIYGLDLAD